MTAVVSLGKSGMSGDFDRCPHCDLKPSTALGFVASTWIKIYECEDCGQLFCHQCADEDACPACGSTDRSVAGKCWR